VLEAEYELAVLQGLLASALATGAEGLAADERRDFLEEAYGSFRHASGLRPREPDPRFARIWAAIELGRKGDALDELKRLRIGDLRTHVLSVTLPDGTDIDAAAYVETRLAELTAALAEARRLFELGEDAIKRVDLERAARLYERGLDEWPDTSAEYIKLAELRGLTTKDRAEAEREQVLVLERGLAIRPLDPPITLYLAQVLAKGGKLAAAAGYIEEALAARNLTPTQELEFHITLGDYYVNLAARKPGYLYAALDEYRIALGLAPGSLQVLERLHSTEASIEMRLERRDGGKRP
jgi:tetratricopeptide (TPR) repeat protein